MEHRLQGRIQEVGKAVKFTVSEGVAGYARVGEAAERGRRKDRRYLTF